MSIKSLGAEGYMVDVRPQGREGKRVRRKFKTKAEAQQYERWVIATQNNKDWVDKPADQRPLLDLIELWWKYHGQNMKDGVKRAHKLERIDEAMGFPKASQVNRASFADYRAARIENGIKPATVNREQGALSSLFTVLIDNGNYHNEHPIIGINLMRIHAREMGFLSTDEINALLESLTGKEQLAAKLCLSTGARWGEVVKLTQNDVIQQRVTFVNTKNSKNRTVPISAELFKELKAKGNGKVFPDVDYLLVRQLLKEVAPDLPKGQAIHALRHTFASHFMMNGGNILTLQKILGHSNILQTMTYAHLAPDYLQDAVRFNPLAQDNAHG
ncbi:phage integrase [Yersinia enterocolitica]|uniref:phage integrase n=1 Tax=Yersinia enterocolitica TaxID=630 RepID=UPI0021E80EB7|nr:tyrosine-type recombinase/integrase [Yersinia enterocolitica]EKN4005642.1 tyrosine-type recombinase/integrase [Yersinia enterocolitica]UYK04715.1 tyrosine-type recombinase/integrase [Yersinia enterocolitica]